MSDKVDENLISSPAVCKLSNLNNVNKMYTPCRRVGLKRKSISSPFNTNVSKKTNLFGSESNKSTILNGNSIILNTEAKDKSITKIHSNKDVIQRNIEEKQRKIKELKSELKNSEQHSLDKIQKLSTKWLSVCQEALMSLLHQLNQQNSIQYTLKDLIANMGLDPDLIKFDSINEEFY